MQKDRQDVLVALMPGPPDLQIAVDRGWYRVRSREMAGRIKGGLKQFKHIAFYQPDSFKSERRCVRWFAPILGIESVPRIDLLPDEPNHPRANDQYLKFNLGGLQELSRRIPSERGRRILFIPTNWQKIELAQDINDLFIGTPIEEVLYRRLRDSDLLPEREYFVHLGRGSYCLDFALFCKDRSLNIETDGDTWHARREAIATDNQRDNLVQSNLWQVLRFNTVQIRKRPDETMTIIRETVNKYGGIIQPDQIHRHFDNQGHLTPGQTELDF